MVEDTEQEKQNVKGEGDVKNDTEEVVDLVEEQDSSSSSSSEGGSGESDSSAKSEGKELNKVKQAADEEASTGSSEGEGDDELDYKGMMLMFNSIDSMAKGQMPAKLLLEQDGEKLAVALAEQPNQLRTKDKLGRTLVHLCLIRCLPNMLKVLLAVEDAEIVSLALKCPLQVQGKPGLPVLHLCLTKAAFPRCRAAVLECLEQLVKRPEVDVDCVDAAGRTALHLACLQGSTEVANFLLEHGARSSIADGKGWHPLHYAIDGFAGCDALKRILKETSATEGLEDKKHPLFRCIDVQNWFAAWCILAESHTSAIFADALSAHASQRGVQAEWEVVVQQAADGVAPTTSASASSSTILVTHDICCEHGKLPPESSELMLKRMLAMRGTPENPHRLEVLCGESGILRSEQLQDMRWFGNPSPAPMTDILRVHEFWYIRQLMDVVEDLTTKEGAYRKQKLDKGDTQVSPKSWHAALRACGSVLEAVDQVCTKQARNAFCAVRPPGHHVGPAGACSQDLEDDPEGSQGFCLLNNVAIGAAYARCVHRSVVRKVAIVDFDVHHGNGTEAAVRNVVYSGGAGRKRAASKSISAQGFNIELTPPPASKPWLDAQADAKEIFFASMHGYGNDFYPGSGASCCVANPSIMNVTLPESSGSDEFRAGLRTQILPALLHFHPDILFISAGFDGHSGDPVGNSYCCEDDYVWATQQLVAIANRCCDGRLVSVLEGGYNTVAESLSPFALSVAAHVRTLLKTSPSYTYLENEELSAKARKCFDGFPPLPELDADTMLPRKKRRIVVRLGSGTPAGEQREEGQKAEECSPSQRRPSQRQRLRQLDSPEKALVASDVFPNGGGEKVVHTHPKMQCPKRLGENTNPLAGVQPFVQKYSPTEAATHDRRHRYLAQQDRFVCVIRFLTAMDHGFVQLMVKFAQLRGRWGENYEKPSW